jgi:hypothetical protein
MACDHKFKEYLYVEKLDFEPTTLIVGTFNPAWPESNYADWFYGRVSNNYFWDILPKMYDHELLRNRSHREWKSFCKQNKIAITDLVSCIEDADIANSGHGKVLGGYADSSIASRFKQQKSTGIVELLEANPTINNVYLTTTTSAGLWYNLWSTVSGFCKLNNKYCRQLMTPSKGARFFMTKASGIKMPEFIYNDWKGKWNY